MTFLLVKLYKHRKKTTPKELVQSPAENDSQIDQLVGELEVS